MVQMFSFQQQHIALRLAQVARWTKFRQVSMEDLEMVVLMDIFHLHLIMKQLTRAFGGGGGGSYPSPSYPGLVVVLVAAGGAENPGTKGDSPPGFTSEDLHIHYHMELLLDMVVTVVVDIVDLPDYRNGGGGGGAGGNGSEQPDGSVMLVRVLTLEEHLLIGGNPYLFAGGGGGGRWNSHPNVQNGWMRRFRWWWCRWQIIGDA